LTRSLRSVRSEAKAVADATNGLDRGSSLPEFLAEVSNDDVDDVASALVVVAPHVLQEGDSFDDVPFVLMEVVEDLELKASVSARRR
jgi:hypothetical protein